MTGLLRQTWALLLGIAIFMLGYGLQGTLLGVRAILVDLGPSPRLARLIDRPQRDGIFDEPAEPAPGLVP